MVGWILRTSSIMFIYIHSRYTHTPTHTPRHTGSESCDSFPRRVKRVTGLRTTPLPLKRMSTERPIESGRILHQRKCRPLPEPPVSPWSIPALVPAACATSHMIPTVPPLFRKSDSCERRERGLRPNPLPPKRGRQPTCNLLQAAASRRRRGPSSSACVSVYTCHTSDGDPAAAPSPTLMLLTWEGNLIKIFLEVYRAD